MVLQIMRPPLVVVVLPCRIMRAAVELDDERGVIAEEIDNIRPDGSLLPEADGVGFEEVVPEMALGGGHVVAKGTSTRLGKVTITIFAQTHRYFLIPRNRFIKKSPQKMMSHQTSASL